MKIAVTGASGHIGVNLCRNLLDRGHSVRVLVHRKRKGLESLPLDFVSGDLRDAESLAALVKGAEAVFHLAAVISIRGDTAGELFDVNVKGTGRLLEASRAAGVRKFIHFSSIHALEQRPVDRPLDEARPLALEDRMAYSRSKAWAEKAVIEAAEQGIDAVILSPTAVIGPRDYGPSLLGRALILMARGKLPLIVSGGYDWVDVRDVAGAAAAALEKGRRGHRYLLSGHWYSLKELAEKVAALCGVKPRRFICPQWVAAAGLPIIRLYCSLYEREPLYTRDSLYTLRTASPRISCAKAERELGYHPRSLEETLRDTLAWFRKHGYLD